MEARRASPYRPLWVYHFFAFINRLPIPGWLLCLLIIVIVGVANHLVAWQQGNLPYGRINGYLATVGLYIVVGPSLWAFFTERADRALTDFFQGSGRNRAQVQAIISDFNSLPDWEFIFLLAAGLFVGFYNYYNITVTMIPLSAQVLPSLGLLSWLSTNGMTLPTTGRAVRQIVLIRNLYAKMEVDIFNPGPVFVLSRYASSISIAILIITYGFQSIAFPAMLLTPVGFLFQFLTVSLALSLFFIPLAGINRKMHMAKEQLLSELSKDLKDVQQRVHQSVASKKLAKISDLRTAVSALKDEMEMVQKIRSSPWQTETLRNLLTPLLIPVVVYLVQRFLGGLFGL